MYTAAGRGILGQNVSDLCRQWICYTASSIRPMPHQPLHQSIPWFCRKFRVAGSLPYSCQKLFSGGRPASSASFLDPVDGRLTWRSVDPRGIADDCRADLDASELLNLRPDPRNRRRRGVNHRGELTQDIAPASGPTRSACGLRRSGRWLRACERRPANSSDASCCASRTWGLRTRSSRRFPIRSHMICAHRGRLSTDFLS
jgi:hypothetical protein